MNRKLLSRIILRLSLGLMMAASAFAQEETVIQVGDLKLTAPTDWYQASVPLDEPNLRAVVASDEPAEVQALLLVSIVPKNGRSLEAFNSMTRNYIATRMDGVVEYERSRALDGYPAHTFVYEGRSEHSAQGRRKFMRTVVDKGTSFYVLQGVADPVSFAARAGVLESMINSISWTN